MTNPNSGQEEAGCCRVGGRPGWHGYRGCGRRELVRWRDHCGTRRHLGTGETIPNLVIVPVGADGKVDFYNVRGSVSLVADLAGYYVN